jgi:hypothetical protein
MLLDLEFHNGHLQILLMKLTQIGMVTLRFNSKKVDEQK